MIKHIDFQGERYPYRVSYHAISRWQSETKKSIDELDKVAEDMSLLEPLFYYALEAGHMASRKKFEVERSMVSFILDECITDFIEALPDFFTEGPMAPRVNLEDTPQKKERKKVYGK
jgi:hypothetical protein